MMNKKLFSTLLMGGLLFSFTGGFVSCSEDYDGDIKDLQTQITANSNAIAEIQALLARGVVITNVTKNAEGILLTMSDGSTQQLTNGKDGVDGTNGADGKDGQDGKPGSVVTIGENGNWHIDGVDQHFDSLVEISSFIVQPHFFSISSSVCQIDDKHVVSVVITSTPIRKSTLKLSTPGPTNSITLFLTNPFPNTSPIIARATSCGPTPFIGVPVR